MENNEEDLDIKTKIINGIEMTNLEYAKIAMILDYLILDRFQEHCSFFRLEKCFGPFFMNESKDFLVDVFKEICGPRHKYISLGRLILAYTNWKSKISKNENFNKFMDKVFNEIINTKEQSIGQLKEGGRIFSTRNTRGRKVISRFSVLTDETMNKLRGFHIKYDDVFDNVLSPVKTKDSITLEMNFPPKGTDIRDRDGISHVGGKYSTTKECIKFLIFKCRSGKTFYIGNEKEEEGENIKYFLFGTSSCQLKSVRVELFDEQLTYFEPKFQPSLRINQKIVDFDFIDENYIKENIINEKLIFEENEIQDLPLDQLEENNGLIIPCINDDAFIDKKELEEPLSGKNFNDVYKTLLVKESEIAEKEKEDLKNKIYEKTIMRKHLLRVYLKKFKVKENISVLKANQLPQTRIKQDKFLAKIKAYRKKMDAKIEAKKEEIKDKEEIKEEQKEKEKEKNDEEGNYWDDEEEKDWPKDESIEIEEVNSQREIINEDKKEIKVEIPVIEEKKEIKVEIPVIEENKNNEFKEEELKEKPKIVMRGKPKKLINHKLNALKDKIEKQEEQNKKEEINEEIVEPKEKELKKEDLKKEEIKKEEPKKEEPKKEEPKKEEPKKEEQKKEEAKNENIINEIKEDKKNNNKINISKTEVKKDNKIIEINSDNNKIDTNINNNIKTSNTTVNKNKKTTQSKPAKKWWCEIF